MNLLILDINEVDYKNQYYILIKGFLTDNVESIILRVKGFNPYFYIKSDALLSEFKETLSDLKILHNNLKIVVEDKLNFDGYNGYIPEKYFKLTFNTKKEYDYVYNKLKYAKFDIFDTKLETYIKFLHHHKIQPSSIDRSFLSSLQLQTASVVITIPVI